MTNIKIDLIEKDEYGEEIASILIPEDTDISVLVKHMHLDEIMKAEYFDGRYVAASEPLVEGLFRAREYLIYRDGSLRKDTNVLFSLCRDFEKYITQNFGGHNGR